MADNVTPTARHALNSEFTAVLSPAEAKFRCGLRQKDLFQEVTS